MNVVAIGKALHEYGPWGLVAVLLVAFWWKDKQYQSLVFRIVRMVETSTSTNVKVEGALRAFKDLLVEMIRKADRRG